MGLDQFLKKHHQYYPEAEITIIRPSDKKQIKRKVNKTTQERIYWRKANAIHRWFVKNIQEGNDDCKEYNVDENHLKLLLETIKTVLNKKELAQDLLPTQEGFFFGNTEYDEDYFADLEFTKKELERILQEDKDSKENGEIITFTYQSSW